MERYTEPSHDVFPKGKLETTNYEITIEYNENEIEKILYTWNTIQAGFAEYSELSFTIEKDKIIEMRNGPTVGKPCSLPDYFIDLLIKALKKFALKNTLVSNSVGKCIEEFEKLEAKQQAKTTKTS